MIELEHIRAEEDCLCHDFHRVKRDEESVEMTSTGMAQGRPQSP